MSARSRFVVLIVVAFLAGLGLLFVDPSYTVAVVATVSATTLLLTWVAAAPDHCRVCGRGRDALATADQPGTEGEG